jgi:hypothetical protein
LLTRRTTAEEPATEAQEDRQPFIDGGDLGIRKFTECAPDTPLVDGSKVIDQRE